MKIAQVTILRMFESYTASSEDYNPDELIFRCMHCGHDFRILGRRNGQYYPVTAFCPQCRMLLHYGARNSDNVWARYNKVVPVTMFLYLHEHKDFVKLAVYGKGLSPAPRGSLEYWQEHSYKEEFRFDVKRRRTIWTQHVKGESRQMELCDPKVLIELGQSSMIRYLYTHFSIAKHKSEVLNSCVFSERPSDRNWSGASGINCPRSFVRREALPAGCFSRSGTSPIGWCSKMRRTCLRICESSTQSRGETMSRSWAVSRKVLNSKSSGVQKIPSQE